MDLIDAVRNNNFQQIKYLVEHGADIRIWNDYPLRIALDYDHFDIVKYLISYYSDTELKTLFSYYSEMELKKLISQRNSFYVKFLILERFYEKK
ncbi:ankyrin repeat domain-containing protein [Candidatus Pacearchaeota archaeon]|jgi:ankyrin repeat protein|nr:ankyrin repeat domain-containing protein [Candidatus Pacearchaeota archaeon]